MQNEAEGKEIENKKAEKKCNGLFRKLTLYTAVVLAICFGLGLSSIKSYKETLLQVHQTADPNSKIYNRININVKDGNTSIEIQKSFWGMTVRGMNVSPADFNYKKYAELLAMEKCGDIRDTWMIVNLFKKNDANANSTACYQSEVKRLTSGVGWWDSVMVRLIYPMTVWIM